MCTVAVHAIVDCRKQLNLRAAKSAVRAEKKETKAQLSRARKPRRCVKWGKAPIDFRLTRSGSTTGWGQQKRCGQLILPRAWKRSIGGCGKLVKKNSYPNHKILCSRCRKRLPIVVSMLTDAASSTCGKCVRANENRRGKISQSVAIARGWACGRKRKQHCSRKFTRGAAVADFNISAPNGIFAGACCATALPCKLLRSGKQSRSQFQNRLQDRNRARGNRTEPWGGDV